MKKLLALLLCAVLCLSLAACASNAIYACVQKYAFKFRM